MRARAAQLVAQAPVTATAICLPESGCYARAQYRRSVAEDRLVARSSGSVHDVHDMPQSSVMYREANCLDSESDSGSAVMVICADQREAQSPASAMDGDEGHGSPDSTAPAVAPRPQGP